MKIEFEKPTAFDFFTLTLFLVFLSLSLYFSINTQIILAILSFILSTWALMIFVARIVFGPAYIEGHIVRLLLKKEGTLPIHEFHSYYSRYDSIEPILGRLQNRNVVEIKNETIVLKEDNFQKGFKNKLMMWGTRNVKL